MKITTFVDEKQVIKFAWPYLSTRVVCQGKQQDNARGQRNITGNFYQPLKCPWQEPLGIY